jgi:hypothetical protein
MTTPAIQPPIPNGRNAAPVPADPPNVQRVFEALPERRCLHTAKLAAATGLTTAQIAVAAGQLIRRNLVERAEAGCFRLTAEGVQARRDGFRPQRGVPIDGIGKNQRSSLRIRLWRAMRLKQKFTVADLLRLASRDEKSARSNTQHYLADLNAAGFLRRLPPVRGSNAARYALIRDAGPEAPVVRRTRGDVWDPNGRQSYPIDRGTP